MRKRKNNNLILGIFTLFTLLFLVSKGYGDNRQWEEARKTFFVETVQAKENIPTPTPTLTLQERAKLDEAEGFIKFVFGKEGNLAVAVAKGECNGLKLDCRNVSPREHSIGLFQINIKAHWAKIPGKTLEQKEKWLLDYKNNVSLAKIIRDMSGWTPWTAYLNGSYKKFLIE